MQVIYEPKGRAGEYSHLAANLFKGCRHGCDYCYGPATLHKSREVFIAKCGPRDGVIAGLKRQAPALAETNKRVLLCFTCDPYQGPAFEQRVTKKAITILRDNDVPFTILTKGGLRATRDFHLYGPRDAFGASLTFSDDDLCREHEPHAASPHSRIKALSHAKAAGIFTWASMEPVIDPTQSLELIIRAADHVDHFMLGKLNHDKEREAAIDWQAYAVKAVVLCEKFGKTYTVKVDLAQYLADGPIPYTNTDIREVSR